jgi:hypothetical protein
MDASKKIEKSKGFQPMSSPITTADSNKRRRVVSTVRLPITSNTVEIIQHMDRFL